jgi:hypothetical protein
MCKSKILKTVGLQAFFELGERDKIDVATGSLASER